VTRRARGLTLVAGLALAALGFDAVVVEPRSLGVVHDVVRWAGPPMTVALISDLHVGSPFNDLDRLSRLVERANAEHPDLVLLLGDFGVTEVIGGSFVPAADYAPILGALHAPLGVRAVLGNHDWWDDAGAIRAAIESAGVPVLDNRSERIDTNRGGFWLCGIGDWSTGHADVARALAGVPGDGVPVLAMTHNPDVFPDLPARIGLLVAGHTHGGQVKLPFALAFASWMRGARETAEGPYGSGVYEQGAQTMVVTSGVGTSILPVRFRVTPEIRVLTLSQE